MYIDENTAIKVKITVNTGYLNWYRLSSSTPPHVPTAMIPAICIPIPEYLSQLLGEFFGEFLFFGCSVTFYVFNYTAHAARS